MNTNNKFNQYSNPFELGTNEYNQSLYSGVSAQASSNVGENFSFIAPPTAQEIIFPELNQTNNSNEPLAFSSEGQSFLTFSRPPEWFIKEQSIKTLESASSTPTEPDNSLESVGIHIEVDEPKQDLYALVEETMKEEKKENIAKTTLGTLAKAFAPVANGSKKIFTEVVDITKTLIGFFFEGVLGFGSNPRPKTEEEKKEEEKEAKRVENKKIFWSKLAELSKPVPIAGALKEEMVITNQLNSFNEQYEGTVDKKAGHIFEYHKANRIKKEQENKAHKLQQERAAKLQKVSKKAAVGPMAPRAGELLMGAENPSHFTKALG